MEDKFLPIGSVVLLKNGTKKVMITGFCTVASETPEKKYDYCGCLYPEGILKSDVTCVFDHSQINEICFTGYKNEEEEKFKLFLDGTLTEEDDDSSDTNIFLKLDSEPVIEYL